MNYSVISDEVKYSMDVIFTRSGDFKIAEWAKKQS